MLARLLEIDGLRSVDVDHAGMLIRVSCQPERTDQCLSAVRASLDEAGLKTHLLEGAQRQAVLDGVERWYDLPSVDALSHEELTTLKEKFNPKP